MNNYTEYVGNNIVVHTFMSKQEIIDQIGNYDYGTATNVFTVIFDVVAACSKSLNIAFVAGTATLIKTLGYANQAQLKQLLLTYKDYTDFGIVITTTYAFDGYGTGSGGAISGYKTYRPIKVESHIQDASN